jgi:methionyl-tRNA synthetase
MLKPVLPSLASNVEKFLNIDAMNFTDVKASLGAGHAINDYKHLMQRVDVAMLGCFV